MVDDPALCTSAGPGEAPATVRPTGTVWVADIPVPVTVMVEEPRVVAAEVVTVMVEDCPAVTVGGLKDTEAPLGAPVALRATDWVAPLVTVVEMVLVPDEPRDTLTEVGAAAIEKSEGGGAVPKEYVWGSNVWPVESVGVTVTRLPFTVTSRNS